MIKNDCDCDPCGRYESIKDVITEYKMRHKDTNGFYKLLDSILNVASEYICTLDR